jgi:hypothetical protein
MVFIVWTPRTNCVTGVTATEFDLSIVAHVEEEPWRAKAGEQPMNLSTAINFFSSAAFNSVNGTIWQDEFGTWGARRLVLGDDNIQIVDRDGKLLKTRERE